MTTTVTAKIQLRRGTAAQWTSSNPTLLSGELGYETDTGKLKIGNGTTAWVALDYSIDPTVEVVVDHGALTGLADDDHTQYHTDARGDARYALTGHNHSGTYEPADATILKQADVDDTPVNGVTTAPVSSNWAYDHAALTTAHGISSFGASLVDDVDASTARSTLGLGTAATSASGDFVAASGGIAASIHAATEKTTPVDADEVPLVDSAAAFVLKRLTLTNLWTYIYGKISSYVGMIKLGASGGVEVNTPIKWTAVDTTIGSPNLQFNQSLIRGVNLSTHDNQVYQVGFNVSAGGGIINSLYSGFRDAFEEYYEPTTSGQGYNERHIACVVPLDYATKGEIRQLSFMARANVNRDSVTCHANFSVEYVSFTHPSSGGSAVGDTFRITQNVSGSNYYTNFTLNAASDNYAYGAIQRFGTPKGPTYPIIVQQNAARNSTIAAMYWTADTNEMHLNFNNAGGRNIVHIGELAQPSTFYVDGLSTANSRSLFALYDKYGTDGEYQAFIGQDGAKLLLGGPQTKLANANDATILAAAHAALSASGLGVGVTTVSAKIHSISTNEQLRLGYNASYYASFTVSSTGNLTIDTVGNTIYTPDTIENTTAGAGIVLKSPDGTRYKITVANGGTLSVAAA